MSWPTVEELQRKLFEEDPEFSAWVRAQPDKHWAKLDISGMRIGFMLGRATPRLSETQIEAIRKVLRKEGSFRSAVETTEKIQKLIEGKE